MKCLCGTKHIPLHNVNDVLVVKLTDIAIHIRILYESIFIWTIHVILQCTISLAVFSVFFLIRNQMDERFFFRYAK